MPDNPEKISSDEKVVEIEMERLHPFRNHPFKVTEDQQMSVLVESISKYGILNPLIVRPVPEGWYEIISGHRRKYAAEKLGYRKLPVIIRVLKDDEAVISMVDANLHRETIRPSEKAFAYKMKYDAIKRKSGRRNSSQIDHEAYGRKTVDIMGEEAGESAKQIQRYLKITELIPELINMLDEGGISFNPAYEAAFLKKEEQEELLLAIHFTKAAPSLSQAQRIKKLSKEGLLTFDEMKDILSEIKKGEVRRVIFKNEQLYQYFPRTYSPQQVKQEIIKILEEWTAQKGTEKNPAGKNATKKTTDLSKGSSRSGKKKGSNNPDSNTCSGKVSYGRNPSGKSYIVTGNRLSRNKPASPQ